MTHFDQESISVNVVFFDVDGHELERVELCSLPPHDMFLDDALGKFTWANDAQVKLQSKDRKQHWLAQESN